jgi:hypothetical protein
MEEFIRFIWGVLGINVPSDLPSYAAYKDAYWYYGVIPGIVIALTLVVIGLITFGTYKLNKWLKGDPLDLTYRLKRR